MLAFLRVLFEVPAWQILGDIAIFWNTEFWGFIIWKPHSSEERNKWLKYFILYN